MSLWLKQSTSVVVQFGPFVDKTDGVTLETGLATAMDNATTGIRLSKNGAAFADRGDATAPAYDAMGCYRITLSTTDTGTLGTLKMIFEEAATCLPVWQEFMVVPANVWDTFFGADNLDVNVTAMAANVITDTAINADAITSAKIADNAIAAEHIAAAAIDNATFAADVGSTAYATNIIALAARKAIDDYDGPTDTEMVAAFTEIKGATWAAGTDTLEHIRDKETDIEADTDLIDDATSGLAKIATDVAAILVDTGTTLPARFDGVEGATFDTNTDSLEALRNRGDAAWTTGAGGSPPTTLQNTTIATLASQTSFTLTAGSADDNAYVDAVAIITDQATSTQKAVGVISAYTGATKTVTLKGDPGIFTMATGDTIDIIVASSLVEILFNKIADHAARRSSADSRASADGDTVVYRSPIGSRSTVHNKVSTTANAGSLTIYEEDDSTEFVVSPLTTDASADPITVIDPP